MFDLNDVSKNKLRIPIDKLDLWKDNPKTITREHIDELKYKVIKYFESDALVVDGRENHLPTFEGKPDTYPVVSGNAALLAIRELIREGLWPNKDNSVYCEVRRYTSDKDAIEYALLSNSQGKGMTDKQRLAELADKYELLDSSILLAEIPFVSGSEVFTTLDAVDFYGPSKDTEVGQDPTKPKKVKECKSCGFKIVDCPECGKEL